MCGTEGWICLNTAIIWFFQFRWLSVSPWRNIIFTDSFVYFVQCVQKVAVHLGYGT
jgi:hypothetical protein